MSVAGPAWALAFLREARVGRLATADAAGRPLVVPVCYAFDGACCWSAVDAKPKRTRQLRRLRNIAENPRAALVVDHYEEDWRALRWVLVEGPAEVLTDGPATAGALDLLRDKYRQYREGALPADGVALIRLTAERLLHWRGADGGGPGPLDETPAPRRQ
ncbi:MAG TPA: TIGR03668 family PPOX class F420-dependent oxidoreductase [Methylomirabilota bacterium]|nr:TIGR03668 family PPOX class F420-dependent oxidoreductase [Methylomirabilota bacterium]